MPARTRTALPFALALCVASTAIARPAHAQDAAVAPAPVAAPVATPVAAPVAAPVASEPATPAPVGPTMDAAAVGVRHLAVTTTAAAPRGGYGQPVALMVVGGAAVLVGLIIGGSAGTVIAVGGAVAGLFGLYQYLQ